MIKEYIDEKAQLSYVNRFLKLIIVFLCLCIISLGVALYYSISVEKVILLPPEVSEPVSVSGNDADENYLKSMVKYICYLSLNYNPQVVEDQFSDLLKIFSPDSYSKYKETFILLANKVKTANIVSSFFVSSIKVDRALKKIVVTGKLTQWFGQSQASISQEKTYRIDYEIKNGKFMIVNFYECTGGSC